HRRRNLAGKRALLLVIHVLRAQLDGRSRQYRMHGGQRDRWRAEHYLDPAHRHQIAENTGGKVARLGGAKMHLPLARANRRAITHDAPPPVFDPLSSSYRASRLRSAATPGTSRPSRNSSDAPPPVETCVTFSAAPAASTAAAESPPPTIVVAPAVVRS